ncbi:MAG: YbaB/EbfC family nucleoid-associated protein, partial [Flavobacteriia bacterium]|nr:YbaB/EbfC family nucleoid-associated protein [Flavobacteriia bacterium]
MFGGMKDMMAKLQEAQVKVEEAKERLNTITVQGASSNGKIIVTMTGNRKVTDI